jgi:hypothetical protein
MRDNGYTVEVEDMDDLTSIKARYGVPAALQSCHTAIVDGYVIEGHVPVADIQRLLAERPDAVGLAVPGMPVGSPGMEIPGAEPEPYEVLVFDKTGQTQVFSSYNP